MKINFKSVGLLVASGLAWAAQADKAVIHREVLETCYIASAPALRNSLTGRAGDSNDNNNPCYNYSFFGQTLNYAYQVRSKVLLVIDNESGPATTQNLTETAPAWQSYLQQNTCESRDSFALEAQAFFADYAQNTLQPACKD